MPFEAYKVSDLQISDAAEGSINITPSKRNAPVDAFSEEVDQQLDTVSLNRRIQWLLAKRELPGKSWRGFAEFQRTSGVQVNLATLQTNVHNDLMARGVPADLSEDICTSLEKVMPEVFRR